MTWDTKYVPNFRVVPLISSKQIKISNPTGRTRKVNVCDVHKIVLSDHIINSTPDKQVFGRRGKYINDPGILKEVLIIDSFYMKIFHKSGSDKSKIVFHNP